MRPNLETVAATAACTSSSLETSARTKMDESRYVALMAFASWTQHRDSTETNLFSRFRANVTQGNLCSEVGKRERCAPVC